MKANPVVGLVPLVFLASRGFGRFLVSLPFVNYGGMIADSPEGFRLLENEAIKQARALNAQHIELGTRAPSRLPGFRHKESFDASSASALVRRVIEGFPSKLRSQVRRAQRGMTTRSWRCQMSRRVLCRVFALYARFRGHPCTQKLSSKILEVFPKDAHICVVSHRETPVAGGSSMDSDLPWRFPGRHRISVLTSSRPICCYMARCWNMRASRASSFFDFSRSRPGQRHLSFKERWGLSPISSIGTTG